MHIAYKYIFLAVSIVVIGTLIEHFSVKYSIIMCLVLLSFIALSEILVFSYMYIKTDDATTLILLGNSQKSKMSLSIEAVFIILVLLTKKLTKKIPSNMSLLNCITIAMPIAINCVYLMFFADRLYGNTTYFASIYSVMTLLLVGIVMLIGGLCNIAIAEYYIEVKNIENDSKTTICN